jgi:hypothetical protein
MSRVLLESLRGTGAIHANGVLLRTTAYSLSLWAEPARLADDSLQMVPSIEGHIDITGIAEAVVLAGPGVLTLTIEDGRRLAFQLMDTGGTIVGRGWIP